MKLAFKSILFVSLLLSTITLTAQESEQKEEVKFTVIDEAPLFPNCTGTENERKRCTMQSVQRHIAQNFNADLPNKLGLSPGKKKISMVFKINHKGKVEDIVVDAPHPRLEKECKRVLKKLPRFKPGIVRGKAVGVKLSIPLTILVEEE